MASLAAPSRDGRVLVRAQSAPEDGARAEAGAPSVGRGGILDISTAVLLEDAGVDWTLVFCYNQYTAMVRSRSRAPRSCQSPRF
jgi:hypothetical protein